MSYSVSILNTWSIIKKSNEADRTQTQIQQKVLIFIWQDRFHCDILPRRRFSQMSQRLLELLVNVASQK